jgi:hypothetical protein
MTRVYNPHRRPFAGDTYLDVSLERFGATSTHFYWRSPDGAIWASRTPDGDRAWRYRPSVKLFEAQRRWDTVSPNRTSFWKTYKPA